MFNQPHPARAAVPWQPNAGIAKKLSSRGYATTSWTTDEPEPFADLGYPVKSSGFSADHYQPMRQPLSKQAQASLALLEGEYRNESFGEEKPASQASTATNDHLPFVMDQFAATRKSKLIVNVDSHVLKRAMDHADLAETLKVSPITSDEKIADPIVIHPDVYDDELPANAATSDQNGEAAKVAAEAEAASADEVVNEESSTAEEAASVSEPELEVLAPAEVAEPAVVVAGIDPDEVAHREAEQFAKGLEQGRAEAAAEHAEAIQKAKSDGLEEGMAKGLEQGLAQGKSEGMAEGLQQGTEQGKTAGLAEGERTAREAVAAEMAAQRVLFENASKELNDLLKDSQKFFEPLKRLAMHIAEQVVMGELHTSTKAMERLVQRCLDELDHPVQGAVVLEVHPDDKRRLQEHAGEFIQGMRLEAVQEMHPGSVRVFANDTVVEDLLAHRLEAMAHALLVDEKTWREQSVLTKPVTKREVVIEKQAAPEAHLAPANEEAIEAEATEEVKESITQEAEEDGDVHS